MRNDFENLLCEMKPSRSDEGVLEVPTERAIHHADFRLGKGSGFRV